MSYDKFKNISIPQLEGLLALVEAGSFTKAALKLCISQSALTKQILHLEESADVRVINRSSAGIYLTPEGQVLYDYAKRVIGLREDAKDRLARIRNQEAGHIYISASNIPATYILPSLLVPLQQERPDIKVHMQMYDSEEALQAVLNNQAEIGFIGKETTHRQLITERLWQDKLVLAVPAAHGLAKERTVTVAELARLPFICREQGSGTRQITEERLRSCFGLDLSQCNVICELGSSEAVKEAVLAGLGVTILSFFALQREVAQGLLKIVDIADCPLERFFYLVYRKNLHLTKRHLYFLALVKNYQTSWQAK